jgi:ribosomal RNA-processing protein 9
MKWDLYSGENISVNHRLRLPTSKAPSNKKGKKKASPPDLDNVEGHVDEIWALAASTDGKYLASGGKDRRVGIWEVETMKWIKGFRGHRDSISVSGQSIVQPKRAEQLL